MRGVKMQKYNTHSGVLYDVEGYHVSQAAKKKLPPTDSQKQVIDKMRKRLEEAGVEISYLKTDPETKEDASLLIRSLKNILQKKGIPRNDG